MEHVLAEFVSSYKCVRKTPERERITLYDEIYILR